jgi:PPOX class probable F420-dependent enzyme
MLSVMSLENEKYVLLTTFRRDGRPVSTPVWLAQMPDGEFGFSTASESGKAKRLRHTPRVTLQGCDRSGGDTHGPVYDAQARLVTDTELAQVRAAVAAKYGAMAAVLGVVESVAKRIGAKRFGSERVGVLISLNAR